MASRAPPAGALRSHAVPLAIASGLMMEFIDSTALSTALPTLAKAFQSDPIHLKLALTSYLLALAVFVPASGWAADRFGARRVFLTAMATFLLGSLLCALSQSLAGLVCARVVQGAGGALMTPVGRLIIVETSSKKRLVAAMAWFTTPALIGPLLGPPVAGAILESAPWPWIFLVNLPVGLVGMWAVKRLVPDIVRPDPGRFDWSGFGLMGVAILTIVLLAESTGLHLVPNWARLSGVLLAAGLTWIYLRHARRHSNAVLDIGLLAFPTFRTSLIGGTLMRLGLGATPFLLPIFLQTGLGWSPGRAGLVTVATGVGALFGKTLVVAGIRRWGFKPLLVWSGVAVALLTAAPGLFGPRTPIALIAMVLLATGVARAVQFTSTNTIAFADVPEERISSASTFSQVVQQVGLSFGVSAGAAALSLARPATGALHGDTFLWPFLFVGALSLLAAPVYLRLSASAGSTLRGTDARDPCARPDP